MGARKLQQFLSQLGLLTTYHLSVFRHKRLAWDISSWVCASQTAEVKEIYYGTKSEDGAFLRSVFHTTMLLSKFGIQVVPVFDGHSKTKLKEKTYSSRKIKHENAEKKIITLQGQLENLNNLNHANKMKIEKKIISTKKKCIKPKGQKLHELRHFFDAMGIPYIVAEGEADIQCVDLCVNHICQGILSTDSDMLIYNYGNSDNINLITKINPSEQTCELFNKNEALHVLGLNATKFTYLAVACGTDYNPPLIEFGKQTAAISLLANLVRYFNDLGNIVFMAGKMKCQPKMKINYEQERINEIIKLYRTAPTQNSTTAFSKYKPKQISFEDQKKLMEMLLMAGFDLDKTKYVLDSYIRRTSDKKSEKLEEKPQKTKSTNKIIIILNRHNMC